MARRSYDWWCCLCGARDPDTSEVCPVSEHEMGAGRGLKHLVAHSAHKGALDAYVGAADARQALGLVREAPDR